MEMYLIIILATVMAAIVIWTILFFKNEEKDAKKTQEKFTGANAPSMKIKSEYTLYTILEVNETVSLEELKVAYRKMALIYHPDLNNEIESSHNNFIAIQRAYQTLSNAETRYAYDNKLEERRKAYSENTPKSNPQFTSNKHKSKEKPNAVGVNVLIHVIWYAFIIGLIALAGYYYDDENADRPDDTYKQKSQITIETNSSKSESPRNTTMLNNGDTPYKDFYGKGHFDKKSLSTIKVCNGDESCVVVVLTDAVSGAYCRHAYIKKGWYYKMEEIPNGLYDLKVYYGNGWNKLKTNGSNKPVGGFDYDESFSHLSNSDYISIRQIDLKDRTLYSEHTITLYKVEDGNLRTKDLSKEKFF